MNQFKPHLMDVVYAWANGSTFAQICKMTDVFEGIQEVATTPSVLICLARMLAAEGSSSFGCQKSK